MRIPDRIWKRFVIPASGCWIFTGYRNRGGYGRVGWNGKAVLLHRLVWEFVKGPLLVTDVLDHLCRNRGCCNPNHLEIVTAKENHRRGDHIAMTAAAAAARRDRTHCVNGHELTQENTRIRRRQSGGRTCRACDRNRQREYRRSKLREKVLAV